MAVLAIFALAAIAVASTAAGGLNVYRRATYHSGLQTDLLLALERFEGEVASAFEFDTIPFQGTRTSLSCAGLVRRWDEKRRTFEYAPGRIAYRLDSRTGAFVRESLDYSGATTTEGARFDQARSLATGVEKIEFSFCRYNEETEALQWRGSWKDEEGIPVAVKVSLEVSAPGGIEKFVRTVPVHAWRAAVVTGRR
jgi:hypothetical protein